MAGSPPAGHEPARGKLFCGIDIGASATKLVLIDDRLQDVARSVRHSGVDYAATAQSCLDDALEQCGGGDDGDDSDDSVVADTISTGYGRDNVEFASKQHTEIHCHAVGCYHLIQKPMTVIDIGGQDNKIIHIGEGGQRKNFRMNRKCAAGTGAFVEEIALRLGLGVGDLDQLAASTDDSVTLGSFCTVFSKTEILAHLRQGAAVEQIVRGAFESVVTRIVEMDTFDGEIVFTGGVAAHNPTIARLLSARLGREVTVPPHPQFTGALGAAILAHRAHQHPEDQDA
ncbi:ATPase [bacterium]|nr:MAG: ATPase [bacterium]